MIITDFKSIFIGKKDISFLVDKLEITLLDNHKGYKIAGYKNGYEVSLLPRGIIIKDVMYCDDIDNRGYHYLIKAEDCTEYNEHVCDLYDTTIRCKICGEDIYPEPQSYCEHVVFVYAEDTEGLWAYLNNKAKKYIDSSEDYYDDEPIDELREKYNWEVDSYINFTGSTNGWPKLNICIQKADK